MRCLVPAKAFRKRLATIAATIPRHSPKPLLETVRLEIDERGRGTLCATDLQTWVRVRAPLLRVFRSGVAQLPPRALAPLLGEAGDAELDADPDAFGLTCGAVDRTCSLIVTGRGLRSTLSTHRPEDYPVRAEPPDPGCYALERRHLVRLIRTTAFAVDPACTRYQLGGCCFDLGGDSIEVVATDGRRLAHAWKRGVRVVGTPAAATTRAPGSGSRLLTAVVGARALRVLLRVLDELKGPLESAELDWTPDGYLRVRSGDLLFSSRQLEGRFPAWQGTFPPPSPHRGHFLRPDRLLALLRRAATRSDRDRPRVRLGLEPGKLTLVTGSGAAAERFETTCDCRSGPCSAVFDPEPLIEVLRGLAWESVDLELNGPGLPAVILASGLRYCVMPLDREEASQAQEVGGRPDTVGG